LCGSEKEKKTTTTTTTKKQVDMSKIHHNIATILKLSPDLFQGPLKPFAEAIGRMQEKLRSLKDSCPIRTYIVTSRDAVVGQRALLTLRHWGLKIDECFFMAGAPKERVLQVIKPHIFFDDQISHIQRARATGTPSGHVLDNKS